MHANRTGGRWVLALVAASLWTVAAAAGMRLPADYPIPKEKDSPGQVTFSHDMHVDTKSPDCIICHPRIFAMLKPGTAMGIEILRHTNMEKGQGCGNCHGKEAFGFEDCDMCHR